MTLDVKASLGSYERVFIDVEDAAFEMCPSTMVSDSSSVILSIPRLCGVDDGERRGGQVVCRMAGGRTRSHSNLPQHVRIALMQARAAPTLPVTSLDLLSLFLFASHRTPHLTPGSAMVAAGEKGDAPIAHLRLLSLRTPLRTQTSPSAFTPTLLRFLSHSNNLF